MKACFFTLMVIFFQFTALPVSGTELGYPNRYSSMAEGLFDMIDAFASAFHKKKNEQRGDYNPIPGYQPGLSPGFPTTSPYYTPYGNFYGRPPYTQSPWSNRLNGQWKSNTGEVLIIRPGRFRIYKNRDTFREGQITVHNARILSILESTSGTGRQYEYAEQNGRLALQDEYGNLLLFHRLGH